MVSNITEAKESMTKAWHICCSVTQIRAEEVSQLQYMLELKFSAQGLDKKVRTSWICISMYILFAHTFFNIT